MSFLKILLSVFLFFLAFLPVILKSEDIYYNLTSKVVVSAVLILILIINIVMVVLKKKDKDRKEIEKDELLKFTAELENYIDCIELTLRLDSEYRIEVLHPIHFGYEFNVFNKQLYIKEVLVTNDSFRDKNGFSLCYQIYDANQGGKNINSTLYGTGVKTLNHLFSKIYFPPNTFKMRDLNKGLLMVYITKELVQKARKLTLSINGWIVINEDLKPSIWEKLEDISRVATWEKYDLDMKEYYRISPQFTQTFNYHPWQIDLFNRKIQKYRPDKFL